MLNTLIFDQVIIRRELLNEINNVITQFYDCYELNPSIIKYKWLRFIKPSFVQTEINPISLEQVIDDDLLTNNYFVINDVNKISSKLYYKHNNDGKVIELIAEMSCV